MTISQSKVDIVKALSRAQISRFPRNYPPCYTSLTPRKCTGPPRFQGHTVSSVLEETFSVTFHCQSLLTLLFPLEAAVPSAAIRTAPASLESLYYNAFQECSSNTDMPAYSQSHRSRENMLIPFEFKHHPAGATLESSPQKRLFALSLKP